MPQRPENGTPDHLPMQDWMSAAPTRAVIGALEAAGGAGAARFVGGCVRNALIGRPIDDIDIATVLTPDQAIQALKAAGIKYVPTGLEHGTVTAIAERRPFEVTTLRRDVETDGRRAVVAFTTDWAEDAERRDFRLNALYMDGEGRIYDPTGEGTADALAGRIVFVGDAQTRIREDYLRILRFFRFRAWFGRGAPDAAGLAACEALKEGLTRLSAERVSKELLKLLAAEDPRDAVADMAGAGVLGVVLPEAASLDRFAALVAIERGRPGKGDAELRLAALLPSDPASAAAVAERLRLSNAQRDRLVGAAADDGAVFAGMTPAAARRAIHGLGAGTFQDRVRLAWAGQGGESGPWRDLLALAQDWTPPKFPLSGADAEALGLTPGPALGGALRRAAAFWADHDFQPDRETLIAWLKGEPLP